MNETQIQCPNCDNMLFRRSMNTRVNLLRRQVDRRYDPYICLNCGNTFDKNTFDEPEMSGRPATEGWE